MRTVLFGFHQRVKPERFRTIKLCEHTTLYPQIVGIIFFDVLQKAKDKAILIYNSNHSGVHNCPSDVTK